MKATKARSYSISVFSLLLLIVAGCSGPAPSAAPVATSVPAAEPTAAAVQFYLTADQLPVEVTQGNNPATSLTKGQTIAISPSDLIAVGAGGLGKLLYSDRVTVEILQGTELVLGNVITVAGDRIEVSLIQNFGHTHVTIGENAKASVVLKTDDATITSLTDDTDFSVCYVPGKDGLTCHPVTKGSIQVFGKTGQSQVYAAPPKVGGYTFNGQAPQPPVCFHEQEYKDWLSQMRNGENVDALGALGDSWYKTACPGEAQSATPSPAPTLAPRILAPTATEIVISAGMVQVPGGSFDMGSNDRADEKPIHNITLPAFFIDQTEVTNGRYKACVDAGGCTPPGGSRYANPDFASYPIAFVTWNQANAFCQWDQGKRLPTEAEWEYAARGSDGRRFPWGADFDPTLIPSGVQSTVPVGSYANASPFGAFDLAGNVVEWVADWYGRDYYASSPGENPTGPDTASQKVMRGGSFGNPDRAVYTTTRRYSQSPDFRDVDIGFRCALDGSR